MSYTVTWSIRSKKRLNKLEQKIAISIIKKVEEIKTNPLHFLDKLTKIKAFKLRVGDYRVIIDLNENEKSLVVLTLGHRKDVYKEIGKLFS
ncbi:type II toxin-antitoxin system RelE/ParE family toxin [Candidatus Woesearchaeota archaeon]|nr:type II toxin-antitoxin system RelE/ParE family toxin [Candidatus Woesearchaeota archaeon]